VGFRPRSAGLSGQLVTRTRKELDAGFGIASDVGRNDNGEDP